eukprot:TRINITY_DN12846_c0_g2_i2.p1 TRINITY_DN12846_c0_g2~~TRINITY_DN12846_c0_g2_i2.p1  ORF type:complete len:414 (+),score=61.54 TRINITY_DN12846_c0_g2_i2:98-1339(+)
MFPIVPRQQQSGSTDSDMSHDEPEATDKLKVRTLRSARTVALQSAIRAAHHSYKEWWEFLEDPDSSDHARNFNKAYMIIIVVSVCVSLVQHIDEIRTHADAKLAGAIVESIFDAMFTVEFAFRLISCPSWSAFFLRVTTWIDLASSIGLPLRMIFLAAQQDYESPIGLILLCILPVVRLAKLVRHFEILYLLSDAFVSVLTALPVLFYVLTQITLSFSALLYIFEPRENLNSLPHAIWMTVVTISTVGFGDVTPKTPAGYMTVALLISVSFLFVAIPVGIVGNAFWASWQMRDRVLLLSRTRVSLHRWGYTAEDVKVLFLMVDSDGNGSLDMSEFLELIGQMKLGLSATRIVKLFQLFDKDNNGVVSNEEFIREIYPSVFLEVCKPPIKRNPSSGTEVLARASSAVSAVLSRQ